jgi:hypothetical protein
MSLKITKSSIETNSSISLLDFTINTNGFSEEFANSNCTPSASTKSTYNIQECTVLNCTTVNCTTVACTTINCTTITCYDREDDGNCANDGE